jgi:hypothetical protein
MYFDIERALSMVGSEVLEAALEKANSTEAKTWLNNSIYENEKLKAKSDSKFPEISYCLENFYKNSSRRKRSLPYTALLVKDKPLKVFSTRKLLSLNNVSFEDVENELLLNDPVSAAFGTGVCRYCLSSCPEK